MNSHCSFKVVLGAHDLSAPAAGQRRNPLISNSTLKNRLDFLSKNKFVVFLLVESSFSALPSVKYIRLNVCRRVIVA
jgi:hypothetical protein